MKHLSLHTIKYLSWKPVHHCINFVFEYFGWYIVVSLLLNTIYQPKYINRQWWLTCAPSGAVVLSSDWLRPMVVHLVGSNPTFDLYKSNNQWLIIMQSEMSNKFKTGLQSKYKKIKLRVVCVWGAVVWWSNRVSSLTRAKGSIPSSTISKEPMFHFQKVLSLKYASFKGTNVPTFRKILSLKYVSFKGTNVPLPKSK